MLVGLIGANIQNSLSPALFEDACAAHGIAGHYHLMDLDALPGRSLTDLLAAARIAGFAGVNVTYPCKEAVLPLLDGCRAEARQIGAVNTVTIGAADAPSATTPTAPAFAARSRRRWAASASRRPGRAGRRRRRGPRGRLRPVRSWFAAAAGERPQCQAGRGPGAAVGRHRCEIVADPRRRLRSRPAWSTPRRSAWPAACLACRSRPTPSGASTGWPT